nr:TIGR03960 family B12-binding radical SAM protein [Clostridia bacterium]
MNRNTVLKNISKPGRYTGGEYAQTIKDKSKVNVRWAFCFPDTYEIGMSNLGVRILYGALNQAENVWCERSYAPWPDMGEKLMESGLKLCAHESGDPLADFDVVAFTLQYELCYSTVLYMLGLAGIPMLASERSDSDPIIIGGGPCAYNPEPVADFFDIFSIGEGEEALCEFAALVDEMKRSGEYSREKLLYRAATELKGFYVPSLYDVAYNEDGTIASYTPKDDKVPARVTKRIIEDLDTAYYPDKLIMPYIETVHDRVVSEVFRGCIRGCRFCQAGMVYRPVREKSPEVVNAQTKRLWETTGFDEVSLSSLSISDYSELKCLTDKLLEWTVPNQINLSLPSMRVDAFSEELMKKISTVRQSGLTFAPEAGTQRLRNVINKNVTEEDIMTTMETAFANGRNQVKLYFMQGLPTETDEDLVGIANLAKSVVDKWYQMPNRNKARQVSVNVSVSCFIPKPFTPFQWEKQDTLDEMLRKQKVVADAINDRKVRYNWHEAKVSHIEAVFARGDRKLGKALYEANKRGIKFDAWDETFSYDAWMDTFAAVGIDPSFYANREFGEDEILPWDVIDCGVTKKFLLDERHKAYEEATTENCRDKCSACGASKLGGCRGVCPGMKKAELTSAEYKPEDKPIYKKLPAPKPMRIRFKKTGSLQFISHLDLVRTLKT